MMNNSPLSPRRPYLLRAFYHWLLDNHLTPHLVVNVMLPEVYVPMEYSDGGEIVLNIAPRAVHNLEIANDEVRFNARFGGVPRQVSVPMAAVQAIYARENGAGTMFEQEAEYLKVYKAAIEAPDSVADPVMSAVENEPVSGDNNDNDPPPPPRGGRPKLRVVK